MQTLVHADIFFFITSIFVVVLTIGSGIALYFIILILRDVRRLSDIARREGEKLAGDIDDVRGVLRGEGIKIKSVFDYVFGLLAKKKVTRKKASTTSTNE